MSDEEPEGSELAVMFALSFPEPPLSVLAKVFQRAFKSGMCTRTAMGCVNEFLATPLDYAAFEQLLFDANEGWK